MKSIVASVVLATTFLALGCNANGSAQDAAQEALSKELSCPKESVVATPRADLKAFDLMMGARDQPPSDVAADPARLAEWKKRQQAVEDGYSRQTVWQTRGCNHEQLYVCMIGDHPDGTRGYACVKPAHPPTPAK